MAGTKPRFDCNIFAITHVVNPNHFYMCDKSRFDLKLIDVVEIKIAESVKNNILSLHYEPKKNDCVAFYLTNKRKYIRCEVLDVKQMSNDINYILFAIDYGIPLFTNKLEDIYPVSYSIKQLPSPIVQVGLDVLPAASKFDYRKLSEVLVYHHEWTIEGMDRFWDLVGNDAVVVSFDQTLSSLKYKECRFGILNVVGTAGKLINVNEKLANFDVALKPRDAGEYWKLFKKTTTPVTEKWNDCYRTGGVLKDKMGLNGLPNFEKIFQKILFSEPLELNPRMKQIHEKVLGWLSNNEGVMTEVPEDHTEFEEKADSDYLFELYASDNDDDDDDEEKQGKLKDVKEEVALTREEVQFELEKINLKEKSQNIIKVGLREKFSQQKPTVYLPGGYQVQVAVQGSPKKFNNRSKPKNKNNIEYDDDDDEFVSASNFGFSDHGADCVNEEEVEKW